MTLGNTKVERPPNQLHLEGGRNIPFSSAPLSLPSPPAVGRTCFFQRIRIPRNRPREPSGETKMCVRWWCVLEPGSWFRSACASCMPWHAKLHRCRWKAAARCRVPRFAHARTYVSRHIAPGWDVTPRVCHAAYAGAYANRHYCPQAGKEAFQPPRDACHGIRYAAHSNRPHALRRNGPAPIPNTHFDQ